MTEKEIQEAMTWCDHYAGVFGPGLAKIETCKAGVRYADVHVKGRRLHPCIQCATETATCEKAEYPSRETVLARWEESNRRHLKWAEDIENNICPHCHTPMTKEQVGRCVYAAPCGHRLYQGRV